jgi:tetratricopeptide (TPR) repeat protein
MDGRRKLVLAGSLLAATVGCTSTPKAPAPPPQIAKVPPPPEPQRKDLKPSTYVQMGALSEEAANEPNRSPAERDTFHRQARESFQKALQVDPKCMAAYVALGESLLATGERDQAQAMFGKAIELAPNDANLWAELGAAQARYKDWPNAVASMTKASQLDPTNKMLQTRLGLTLARAGRYQDGLNILAKIMPEAEARFNIARMMKHNQDPAAAEMQLQFALRADPTFEPARQMLAERGYAGSIQQAGYQQPATPPVPAVGAAR